MATGHACTKVFARLKAAIPHTSSPCFEAVRRLEDALQKASLAQAASQEICRLCQIVPEIDGCVQSLLTLCSSEDLALPSIPVVCPHAWYSIHPIQ
ncbi:hypothetical protein M378DRAFT_160523 [Amanita muscaria Koide BX008]|uniref:Uncharacterized protein n=1 Tax=Amanita muscaria (strain Koide BX008) TaxID=946122 RepID=A0A0C2ST64_AMAMK|nr:hypothetical protein M378DRAFT_160523 [Amanita muscaria Koide BX008]